MRNRATQCTNDFYGAHARQSSEPNGFIEIRSASPLPLHVIGKGGNQQAAKLWHPRRAWRYLHQLQLPASRSAVGLWI